MDIPAHSEVLVTATETGIDVTLEVVSADRVIARAASPVYRTGITRLTLRTEAAVKTSLVVRANGDPGVRGQVVIRTSAVSRAAAGDACWRVQKLLSSGDGLFADGQAAQLQAMTTDNSGEPKTDALGEYRAAASLYLTAAKEMLTPTLQAYAELAAAEVLFDWVGEWTGAYSSAHAAARTYEREGDPYGAARARVIETNAFLLMSLENGSEGLQRIGGVLRQTREDLLSLATFHARRSEWFDQAVVLYHLGNTYFKEGRDEDAIRSARSALPIFERLGEERWKTLVGQDIAVTEVALGRLHEAVDQYARLLAVPLRNPADWVFFTILNNSAFANRLAGRMDVALRQYADALQLDRRFQDTGAQARSLLGIGSIYDSLGDSERALDFYRQSLALRGPGLTARDRAASLRSTANVLRSQGHLQEALTMDEKALSHASSATQRASIQIQHVRDFEAMGRNDAALQELECIIREKELGDPVIRARALFERGKIRISMGELSAAEPDLRSAITTFVAGESPLDAFFAWTALAQAQYERGSTPQALESVDHALRLAEEVRLQSANPELRASLLQPLRPAFDLKIELLSEQYFASGDTGDVRAKEKIALEALGTAEQARARAFADFERLDIGRSTGQTRLLEQRRAIYRELAARHFQLESARDNRAKDNERSRGIRADISALRVRLDETEAQINANASARAAKAPSESWMLDQHGIPTDVAIVEYWLGAANAVAWVVTRDRLTMVDLGGSAKITDAAHIFHDSLRAFGTVPASVRLADSAHLYDLVIQPLERYIAPYRTLIFAPDGALHYIPFAALRATGPQRSHFLVENKNIVIATSVRMLLSRPPKAAVSAARADRLLLVADPVYTERDERLGVPAVSRNAHAKETDMRSIVFRSSYHASLPRLANTAREAAAIAALFPPGHVDRLEGFAATKDRFLGAPLDRYRVIHVASHAMTDTQILGLSALALSAFDPKGKKIDNLVFAADFMTLRLNADLVVLSACDTSLGKDVAGEGLMGLRYIVLARGAGAVVASLWEVPDEATSELMTAFYRSFLGAHKSVPVALSEAMRTMLRSSTHDPAVWGSFTATIGATGDQR